VAEIGALQNPRLPSVDVLLLFLLMLLLLNVSYPGSNRGRGGPFSSITIFGTYRLCFSFLVVLSSFFCQGSVCCILRASGYPCEQFFETSRLTFSLATSLFIFIEFWALCLVLKKKTTTCPHWAGGICPVRQGTDSRDLNSSSSNMMSSKLRC
jgi:hypothetical protein